MGGSDERVIAALRSGDELAFRALVKRHGATMRRVAYSFVSDEAVADEVVQETWLASRFEGSSRVLFLQWRPGGRAVTAAQSGR